MRPRCLPATAGPMRPSATVIDKIKGLEFRRITDAAGDTGICLVMFLPTADIARNALKALQAEGLVCPPAASTIQRFATGTSTRTGSTFWTRRPSPTTGLPWSAVAEKDLPAYSRTMCPRTTELLSRALFLDVDFNYSNADCANIANGINKVMRAMLK